MIELSDVEVRRNDRIILKNASLTVKKKETFALIGPTGAGKTTLLRIIDLLDLPDRGVVRFEGIDVTRDEKERLVARRRMSMVFQRPAMFNASVRDNVAYGLRIRGLSGEVVEERIDRALFDVGLRGYGDRKATSLSGGEIQRVALARALVLEPEVLLLDEATANLDPRTAETIERLILRAKEKGLTIIIATHDLDQSRRLAERIGVMIEGELVQVGTADEIFEHPKSREIGHFVGMP